MTLKLGLKSGYKVYLLGTKSLFLLSLGSMSGSKYLLVVAVLSFQPPEFDGALLTGLVAFLGTLVTGAFWPRFSVDDFGLTPMVSVALNCFLAAALSGLLRVFFWLIFEMVMGSGCSLFNILAP